MRKLIYIDSSYTLSQIRDRSLNQVLESRFLNGFFQAVWSAHPVDTHPASNPGIAACGPTICTPVKPNHVFVSGRYGRFNSLTWLPMVNAALALVSFVLKLTRIARTEQIRVVRTGDPLLCGLIGLIVARLAGAKLVVRVNGNHDWVRASTGKPINQRMFRTAWVESWIEKLVLSQADRVILYSGNHKEFALSKGAKADRISIIRHGNLIDPRHFAEPERRPPFADPEMSALLKRRPWMVHVGRLLQIKHAEDCYEVLLNLVRQGSDAGLLFVGDGPLREAISARARAAGLADRVVFTGNIDQETLVSLLPNCTLALSPVTGRALAEVAFAARPVVAYDLDWQSEMVETDVTGILVPERDIAAMTQGAERFLADGALRDQLGTALRARAIDLLDPQAQTRKETDAYTGLGVLP